VSTTNTSIEAIIDATQNNILIDENGNAFVADHGILILCAELHGTSYIKSNVRWTAPENFQVPEDDESITSPQLASDIYSFGCIMLQVCGQILTPCNVIIILLAGFDRKSSVFRISKGLSSYRADI
jgi:serine/threonine protein kinase